MRGIDQAYWLADKIPAYGDYAKEAANVLRRQAYELERLLAAQEELLGEVARLRTQRDDIPAAARRKLKERAKAQAGDAGRLREENRKLRDFARAVMECWPMGDLDGDTLQDAAVAHGLLKPETRHEPCGEGCNCAQYAEASEFESGVVCYRKTPLLKGPNA